MDEDENEGGDEDEDQEDEGIEQIRMRDTGYYSRRSIHAWL
jgi:hypothetical protein